MKSYTQYCNIPRLGLLFWLVSLSQIFGDPCDCGEGSVTVEITGNGIIRSNSHITFNLTPSPALPVAQPIKSENGQWLKVIELTPKKVVYYLEEGEEFTIDPTLVNDPFNGTPPSNLPPDVDLPTGLQFNLLFSVCGAAAHIENTENEGVKVHGWSVSDQEQTFKVVFEEGSGGEPGETQQTNGDARAEISGGSVTHSGDLPISIDISLGHDLSGRSSGKFGFRSSLKHLLNEGNNPSLDDVIFSSVAGLVSPPPTQTIGDIVRTDPFMANGVSISGSTTTDGIKIDVTRPNSTRTIEISRETDSFSSVSLAAPQVDYSGRVTITDTDDTDTAYYAEITSNSEWSWLIQKGTMKEEWVSTISGIVRTLTMYSQEDGGPIEKTVEQYKWIGEPGEEEEFLILSSTYPNGDNSALTTTWAYYESKANDDHVHRYKKLKSIDKPGGQWTRYDYEVDDNNLLVTTTWRPFLDASPPSQIPPSSNLGYRVKKSYSYINPHDSSITEVRSEEWIDGKQTGKMLRKLGTETDETTAKTYSTTYEVEYINKDSALVTKYWNYPENTSDYWLAGRLFRVDGPNYVETDYISNVEVGETMGQEDWNNLSDLLDKREQHEHMRAYVSGSAPLWNASMDDPNDDQEPNGFIHISHQYPLAQNQSTYTRTIMDAEQRTLLEETLVYGSDSVVDSTAFDYIYNTDDNTTTTTMWRGSVKFSIHEQGLNHSSSTDVHGTSTTTMFDDIERPSKITRGQIDWSFDDEASTIPAQTMYFTYDAEASESNRVREEIRIGAPNTEPSTMDALYSWTEYDLDGRVVEQKDVNGYKTVYTYDDNTRRTIVRRPDGQATTTILFKDGNVKSRSGTGIVDEYNTYEIETGGILRKRECRGFPTSACFTEADHDWLGRIIAFRRPATEDDDVVEEIFIYDYHNGINDDDTSTPDETPYGWPNQLAFKQRGTLAPHYYRYDDLGELILSGVDLDGTAGLNSDSNPAYPNQTVSREWNYLGSKLIETYSFGGVEQVVETLRRPGPFLIYQREVFFNTGDSESPRRKILTERAQSIPVGQTEIINYEKGKKTTRVRNISGFLVYEDDDVGNARYNYDVFGRVETIDRWKAAKTSTLTYTYHDGPPNMSTQTATRKLDNQGQEPITCLLFEI